MISYTGVSNWNSFELHRFANYFKNYNFMFTEISIKWKSWYIVQIRLDARVTRCWNVYHKKRIFGFKKWKSWIWILSRVDSILMLCYAWNTCTILISYTYMKVVIKFNQIDGTKSTLENVFVRALSTAILTFDLFRKYSHSCVIANLSHLLHNNLLSMKFVTNFLKAARALATVYSCEYHILNFNVHMHTYLWYNSQFTHFRQLY